MREQRIITKGDGAYVMDGRLRRDPDRYDHLAPLQGVAGEYRYDAAGGVSTRAWTVAEMFTLGKINAFHYHKHAILWDGIIYDPLRPGPMAVYIMDTLADQIREKIGRGIWRVRNYTPIRLREGFMAVPDLVVLPEWERRTESWPPPAHEPAW